MMPTYEIRISQGSNASNNAIDLPNDATARDEVMAIFGDLARDFVREVPQACACRKSNSHIQMMKSDEKWRRHNATNSMYCSRRRRVFVD